jgi:uncharacterized integral membrane protein
VAARPRARAAARRTAPPPPRAAAEPARFRGVYGVWEVTPRDRAEVALYRGGLALAAAAFALGAAGLLGPADAGWAAPLREGGTGLAAAGGAGLVLSLRLIHIYVTPLKRLLQLFAAAGAAGGVYLALLHPDMPLPAYVAEFPSAVWCVGPGFAALTGVCFKEGVCYRKPEAFVLTLLIPLLLLGHLTELAPDALERAAAATTAVLLAVFAARKYTQPVKDDIGDGSVFAFMALGPEEQAAKLRQLRAEGEILTDEMP